MTKDSDLAKERTRWEFIILGCMFIGYMAFILCRTALPAASPEMVKDLKLGLDEASYGDIAAWGTAGMITGKLLHRSAWLTGSVDAGYSWWDSPWLRSSRSPSAGALLLPSLPA